MPKGKIKSRTGNSYGKVFPRRTKRGQTRWYLDFKDADGKRIREVAEFAQSSNDALLVLRKKVADAFLKRNPQATKKRNVSFEEFAGTYLDDYIGVNRRNWKSDAYRLRNLMVHFRGFSLREITPLRIEELKSRRLKLGNKKSTCNRYLACLKRLFSLAEQEGLCDLNPVRRVKLYSEKDCIRERVLTEDEERRLMSASSERLKPIILVALNSGMRLSEILGLRWDRVDFKRRTLRVERTKSGKVLSLPMNEVLQKELLRLRDLRTDVDSVFPYKSIRTAFENARERAGLPDVNFHSLRHSFASRLIELGVSPTVVQHLLGHAHFSTTERYLHVRDENKRQAVELLCGDTQNTGEKSENLAHGWHMGRLENLRKFPYASFSRN